MKILKMIPRPADPKFDLLFVSLVPEVALKIMIDEISIILKRFDHLFMLMSCKEFDAPLSCEYAASVPCLNSRKPMSPFRKRYQLLSTQGKVMFTGLHIRNETRHFIKDILATAP